MNKRNIFLIVFLMLLLGLTTAFALFSEKIVINGSATAKGSFNIEATCMVGISDEYIALGKYSSTNEGQGGYANDSCVVEGSTVKINVDLLYPTATRAFTIKMTNTGTIPALLWGATETSQIESFVVAPNSSYSLINSETEEVISSGLGPVVNGGSFLAGWGTFVKSADGEINADKNAVYDSAKGAAAIKLNTGDSIYTIFTLQYPDAASQILTDNGKSEYFKYTINHPFKWEQYYVSPTLEDTTFDKWCFTGC